jgi:hypothetical protein
MLPLAVFGGVTRAKDEHRFHIFLSSALALGLAGCSAFGIGQASPPPTVNPQPSPTSTPTPSIALAIDHPTGATDVILRMETGGGLVPMEFFSTQIPQFTLYGDGTAVFEPIPTGNEMIPYGRPQAPLLTAKLAEAEVQELLGYALNDGHLAVASESYKDPMIADGPTTLFTVAAGGYDKSVNVYALGISEPSGGEADDRAHMALLASRLSNFAAEPKSDALSNYDPAVYRVTLFRPTGATPPRSPGEWPWPDISPHAFADMEGRPGDRRVMMRDEVAELTDVPNGGQSGIWVNAPDGSLLELSVRPLLPDEVDPVRASY